MHGKKTSVVECRLICPEVLHDAYKKKLPSIKRGGGRSFVSATCGGGSRVSTRD
jgi:hypothetical protein